MSEFARVHASLFDELERQGIYCIDVGKLTRAVFDAQTIIAATSSCELAPYQRCEACE